MVCATHRPSGGCHTCRGWLKTGKKEPGKNDVPVGVSTGNSKAERTRDVEPEALPELASNGGDGHVEEQRMGGGGGSGEGVLTMARQKGNVGHA